MNITEANHVNTLLLFVLHGNDGAVESNKALEAARYLADRAYATLSAGLTGQGVEGVWEVNLVDERDRMVADEDGWSDWSEYLPPDVIPPAELNAQGKAALG